MPRKQYYLSGNSFTATDDELTVTFDNPREMTQVHIVHAGFTLDLGGPDPPPQLYLRSAALAAATHSRARTVTVNGREAMSDVLGHVTLAQAHDLSSTGHFELQRPVTVSFGNFKGKMPSMDFFLTDHTGRRVDFLFEVVSSIDRYAWGGDYTLNPTGDTGALTLTWGPNANDYVGGALDLPGDDWDLTGTALLVIDNVNYTWASATDTLSGTITGATNSTWTRAGGIITILWGGNAATWYKVEIGDDMDDLVAVSDYNNIYTPGDIVWTKASGVFLTIAVASTWTFNYGTGVFILKWEDDDAQKINGVWDKGTQAFTWSSGDPESWGMVQGDPILTFNDWTNNGVEVVVTNEITEQHPYASMALAVDAAH